MSDLYLFRNTLKDLTRPKMLVVAALLIALPALLALIASLSAHPPTPNESYNTLAPLIVFGFILVLLANVYGTGVITQELEQKTIVYLLTRPVPRWRILFMKFCAALTVTIATIWLAISLLALVTYGPGGLMKSPLGQDLAILPVGAMAYTSLFLFLATFQKRPLITGLLFAFGYESWAPNLGGDFSRLSIMAYLRTLAPHTGSDNAIFAPNISTKMAWMVLLCVIAVTLGGALYLFSVREYVPREETT